MNSQITLSTPRADDIVFVLEFVREWLDYDYGRLETSLSRFNPGGIDAGTLRSDIVRAINQLQGPRP